MLQGVTAERAQIGDRAKIVTAENPRGEFLGVGDTLKGCTISAVEREFIEFSHYWKQGDKTLYLSIPRN